MATNYDSTTGLPPCGWAPRGYFGEVHKNQPPVKPVQWTEDEKREWAANRAADRAETRRKAKLWDCVQELRYAGSDSKIRYLRAKRDRLLAEGRANGIVDDLNEIPYSDGSGYGP